MKKTFVYNEFLQYPGGVTRKKKAAPGGFLLMAGWRVSEKPQRKLLISNN
jgi:hypothetical protein